MALGDLHAFDLKQTIWVEQTCSQNPAGTRNAQRIEETCLSRKRGHQVPKTKKGVLKRVRHGWLEAPPRSRLGWCWHGPLVFFLDLQAIAAASGRWARIEPGPVQKPPAPQSA